MRSGAITTKRVLATAGVALVLATALGADKVPDLGAIYNRTARYHDEPRNPVIVIPGILGSRLKDPRSGRRSRPGADFTLSEKADSSHYLQQALI